MSAPLADAHLHVFRHGFPGLHGRPVLGRDPEIEAYEAVRATHGIHAGLIVGYEADGIDPDNNDHIRALAADRPWMATLAYVDPMRPLQPEAATAILDRGHVGIVLYLPDAATADGLAAWPAETWHRLDRRRAVVSLNARPAATARLGSIIAGARACSFLFSHLGLPGRYPEPPAGAVAAQRLAPLLRLADEANVMVKISGLYAISDPPHAWPHEAAKPFVDLVLDGFGADRCLWASDFSPALDFVSFAQTVANPWLDGLAADSRAKVMGGNLLQLLGQADTGVGASTK